MNKEEKLNQTKEIKKKFKGCLDRFLWKRKSEKVMRRMKQEIYELFKEDILKYEQDKNRVD